MPCSQSSYAPYGEPSQYILGVLNNAGKLTYNRDPQTRRVTGVNLSVQQAWLQVDDLRYSYDPAGNITRIVNVQGHPQNGAPTRTQCFTYDPLNRLSQAWTATDNCAAAPGAGNVGGVNPYRTSWGFDPTGLRTRQVHHALPGATGGDTTTSYTYPTPGEGAVRPHALSSTTTSGPAGQSGTSYGYDQSGNSITRTLPTGSQSLTWTPNNRLATVTTPTGTTSYVYDADGNQLLRRDPGKTTLYLPGQEIVRDTTTGTVTGTRYYTHNGTTVALRVGGANPQYLQSDQHATTQVAVASVGFAVTRREFDPYGNPLGAGQGPWPDQRGFLNKPHNPVTGLTDVGARKYDPTLGRFISVDPVLDLANPQQWNAYGYANNNPTTHSDPTGLKPDYCGTDASCYGYSPTSGCPHGCGTEANENYGKSKGWGPTFREKKALRAAKRIQTRVDKKVAGAYKNGTMCDTVFAGSNYNPTCVANAAALTPEQFYNIVSTEVALEGAEYVTALLEIMARAGLVGTAAILCAASRVCAGAVVYSTPELAPLAPWIVGPAVAYGGTRVLTQVEATAPGAVRSGAATADDAIIVGVLRDASKGKGNFGVGSGTKAQAEVAGRSWVGDGYSVASDGKTLVSRDGLRQYRPPSYKPNLDRWQANFQWRLVPRDAWQSNGHLDILDP